MLTVILSLLLLPVSLAEEQAMVVDLAGLFTDAEVADMEAVITDIRDSYQMDAVVLTVNLSRRSDSELEAYADAFYEECGYGLGDDRSGVLIMLDMGNRYIHISTAGSMISYLNDRRKEQVQE